MREERFGRFINFNGPYVTEKKLCAFFVKYDTCLDNNFAFFLAEEKITHARSSRSVLELTPACRSAATHSAGVMIYETEQIRSNCMVGLFRKTNTL